MEFLNRNYRAFLLVIIVFTGVYISFIASNRDNPVRLSYKSTTEIYSVFPQGWAFFTRDPKEDVLIVYDFQNDKEEAVNETASLSLGNLLGINRKGRRISIELAAVVNKIPAKAWTKERKRMSIEKLKSLPLVDTVENVLPNPILQGTYVIYRANRKPWAWAKSKTQMPYKCIKVAIQ
jgi:antimicrobial peptide system SdpA family protein